MRRMIVLRPEPGASTTVANARKLGMDSVAAPLFEIEPVEWQAPEPTGFDGLLLTSANGGRFSGAQIASLFDHVDLDGNLLLASDPWPGVEFADGVQRPSDHHGLGVAPA